MAILKVIKNGEVEFGKYAMDPDELMATVIVAVLKKFKENAISVPEPLRTQVALTVASDKVEVESMKIYQMMLDQMIWSFEQSLLDVDFDQLTAPGYRDMVLTGRQLFAEYFDSFWN